MKNIMTHLCVQYFLIFFSLLAEDRLSVVVDGGGAGAAIAFRIISSSSMPFGRLSQTPA
jgi:hypothetical protein